MLSCDENAVNEHIKCLSNNISSLKNDFYNHNLKNKKDLFKKHFIYAEFEKDRYFKDNETLKKRLIWNKAPIIIRPFLLIFLEFFSINIS